MQTKQPGRIVYHHRTNLDLFLKRNRPSIITSPDIYWVVVTNPSSKKHQQVDEKVLHERWKVFTRGGATINETTVKDFALQTGWTLGRWTIDVKPSDVDRVWAAVARSLVGGRLGPTAKVCTKNGSLSQKNNRYVIRVYSDVYSDVDDVMRVEEELRELGITGPLYYKPDLYAKLGIYFHNEWGIKPHPYSTMSTITPV